MTATTPRWHVEVDSDLCMATRGCVHALPRVFEIGDQGVAQVIGLADGDDAVVRQIVAECPTGALALRLTRSGDPTDSCSTATSHGRS